jgi:hypothetical protein
MEREARLNDKKRRGEVAKKEKRQGHRHVVTPKKKLILISVLTR